jgi:PLP dependent protein
MHTTVQRLNLVTNKVNEVLRIKQLKTTPKIIAVSKTFKIDKIKPLIEHGHVHFGENKMQEAEDKWVDIKNNNKILQLHMVGKLQSNKAKKAVKLFDFLHSLDSENLAKKINTFSKELNKTLKIFIQVNLGNETQKSGILLNEVDSFYNYCIKDLSLNIIGLMCLPPIDSNPELFFKELKKKSDVLNLKDISMGMSGDYEKAVANGSTYLRLGTEIFGKRNI